MVERRRTMRPGSPVTLLLAAGVPAPRPSLVAQDFPVSPTLPPESRQFDFWVGEWDVNLRVRQEDLTWVDQVQAVARVHPSLGGKAVLELWSDRRESEFFATGRTPDGGETVSRYTFSDITPESLRWDDAHSTDGGETWRPNWIMEFSRTGARPTLSPGGGPEHTYHAGERCSDPEFRAYEFLSGRMSGPIEVGGQGSVTITGHQILDGCAVVTFAGSTGHPEWAFAFSHITWNTSRRRYELTTLTSHPDTPVRMFYSRGTELVFDEHVEGDRAPDRFGIEANGDGSVTWVHEMPDGDGWRAVWRARVRAGGP